MANLREIADALKAGRAPKVKELVSKAIEEGVSAEQILNEGLILGMGEIGTLFKNNEVYVPEVLIAARAMNAGLDLLKPILAAAGVQPVGTISIGTVKGDLHDIGKNLVSMMLEGAGFAIVDLGIDVSPEAFVDSVETKGVQIICMSALLTTTMPNMKGTIDLLNAKGIRNKVKVMIGGAPVTQAYADEIGADGYSDDAASAVDVAKMLLGL
jgi:5-methyltetrahydrofolate--homocysteine methyltransferase